MPKWTKTGPEVNSQSNVGNKFGSFSAFVRDVWTKFDTELSSRNRQSSWGNVRNSLITKIKDGGGRHIEFREKSVSSVCVKIFSQNLVIRRWPCDPKWNRNLIHVTSWRRRRQWKVVHNSRSTSGTTRTTVWYLNQIWYTAEAPDHVRSRTSQIQLPWHWRRRRLPY